MGTEESIWWYESYKRELEVTYDYTVKDIKNSKQMLKTNF